MGITFAVAVMLVVVAGAPAGADHFQQASHAVQFNIYGYNGGISFNTGVAQDVVNLVNARNPRPLFLSLNEVCNGQYNALVASLQPQGYSSMLSWNRGGPSAMELSTRATALNSAMPSSGLAAMGSRRTSVGSPHQRAGDTDRRNWAFMHALYPDHWTCTAHLDPSDPDARVQVAEYYSHVEPLRSNGWSVVASGDLNIDNRVDQNNRAALDPWYQRYWEADNTANSPSASRATTDTGPKLDYIFRANPRSISHGGYVLPRSSSDHHWYQIYF